MGEPAFRLPPSGSGREQISDGRGSSAPSGQKELRIERFHGYKEGTAAKPFCGAISQLYQEAGGVVEEAAETTAEVSLQEGRVFWRDGLGVIGQHVCADLNRVLLTCRVQQAILIPSVLTLLVGISCLNTFAYFLIKRKIHSAI